MIKRIFIFLLFAFIFTPAFTQDTLAMPNSLIGVLLKKEQSGAITLHTNGWGAGYRYGNHVTGYMKRLYEVEFSTMKHPKETKLQNPYYFNSKPYTFGKKNSMFIIRGHIGNQHVMFSKPNWGGVEVRYFYVGGASIAFLKPIYLYILSEDLQDFSLTTEKYDPEEHFSDNIYGRGPFTKGFDEISIKPGASVKAGLNFEYGPYMEKLKTLEVGATLDFYPSPIEIMALNDPNYFFLTLYFSFHFGKRYNKFD